MHYIMKMKIQLVIFLHNSIGWPDSISSSAHSIILTCNLFVLQCSCHHYEASITSSQCQSPDTFPSFWFFAPASETHAIFLLWSTEVIGTCVLAYLQVQANLHVIMQEVSYFANTLRLLIGAKPYTCEGGDHPLGHAKSMSDAASNSCREERKECKTTPLHPKGSNC